MQSADHFNGTADHRWIEVFTENHRQRAAVVDNLRERRCHYTYLHTWGWTLTSWRHGRWSVVIGRRVVQYWWRCPVTCTLPSDAATTYISPMTSRPRHCWRHARSRWRTGRREHSDCQSGRDLARRRRRGEWRWSWRHLSASEWDGRRLLALGRTWSSECWSRTESRLFAVPAAPTHRHYVWHAGDIQHIRHVIT